MTKEEKKIMDELPTSHNKYWLPLMWFSCLVTQARQEKRIKDDISYNSLLQGLHDYRGCCGMLYSYDWISVPIVYTQVTTLAVYIFFLASIFGRQFLDPAQNIEGYEVDLYVPVFTMLQFFFYMGWLKVAEVLVNPFGEDDDDFETNWIIDRNLQVSLFAVDEMYMNFPKLQRDPFFEEDHFQEPDLPYTKASIKTKMNDFMGSTAHVSLSEDDTRFAPMEGIPEGSGGIGGVLNLPSQTMNHCMPSRLPNNILNLEGDNFSYLESKQNSRLDIQNIETPRPNVSALKRLRLGTNEFVSNHVTPAGSFTSILRSPKSLHSARLCIDDEKEPVHPNTYRFHTPESSSVLSPSGSSAIQTPNGSVAQTPNGNLMQIKDLLADTIGRFTVCPTPDGDTNALAGPGLPQTQNEIADNLEAEVCLMGEGSGASVSTPLNAVDQSEGKDCGNNEDMNNCTVNSMVPLLDNIEAGSNGAEMV
ncbi:unnamed protein product [Owenia fusiformis]|uniref:Bestrophin homolog n=1 Tax=Owenia fusiformis TaxID=6347 RepID=A0A8J1TBN6_OWEFU|nr:unnamed protein product [Owenia fusiformis]